MSLARISETLFNNSDIIPEGLYLELMNLTRDLFNEKKPEKIIKWKTLIKYREINKHKLRYIMHFGGKSIQLVDEAKHTIGHEIPEGGLIELMEFGENKTFLKVVKINKCSVIFNKHMYTQNLNANTTQYTESVKVINMKIAQKYQIISQKPDDPDIWFHDLLPKNIVFYDLRQTALKERIDECVENLTN
jgi:hypothetical protein